MHLSDGDIRTYADGEAAAETAEKVRLHLERCLRCRRRAARLASRAESVGQQLRCLSLLPGEETAAVDRAFARFRVQYLTKEMNSMFEKIFSRQHRLAWVGLAVVLILAAALVFPPVRAIANSFLGLFRVEQVAVVPVNPGDLPEQLGSSSQFEHLIADDVQVEEIGEVVTVEDAEAASRLAGIPVRLPTGLEGARELKVQPGTRISLRVDLAKIRALLREVGMEEIQLPDQLDGALVTMDLSRAVTASYGACALVGETVREPGFDPDDSALRRPDCTTLVQMESPAINAPPGLDIAGLGEAFLIALGMTPEEARAFSQQVDWTTTLVVPIPRFGVEYQEVSVDGVTGTFIQQHLEGDAAQYMLVWIKDGVLYALTGSGNNSTAMQIAGSLE